MKKFICELACFFLVLAVFLVSGAAAESTLPLWLCAVTDLILCAATRFLYLMGEGRLHRTARPQRAAVRCLPDRSLHVAHGRPHHVGAA